jgi:hypothetical protein
MSEENKPKTDKSNSTHYQLSEAEKAKAIELYNKHSGSLNDVIRALFNDPNEKGTSERGRAVRSLFIEQGLKYATTGNYKVRKKKKNKATFAAKKKEAKLLGKTGYELTSEEKAFVRENYSLEVTKSEVARLLWPQEAYGSFFDGPKFIALSDFISEEFPQINAGNKIETSSSYSPPKQLGATVKKASKFISKSFDPNKLSTKDKRNFESLLSFLNSPRFVQIINSYVDPEVRELFESEYIRAVWDKPDLTIDELNLYINICMDYINMREIEKQKQKLNVMFDNIEGNQELTIRLVEMIKTKSEEYNHCAKRIDATISKLNGDRNKKLEKQGKSTANIASLVEAFQEERERKLMIEMAEKQKEAIKEEADRLEEMPEWKARVIGISKYEAI